MTRAELTEKIAVLKRRKKLSWREIAAKMGPRYIQALEANEPVVAQNVTANLWERHIKPVFLGQQ